MAEVLFEGLLAQCTLASFNALAVKLQSPGKRAGSFGQEHVGVGTIGRNLERLSGQLARFRGSIISQAS